MMATLPEIVLHARIWGICISIQGCKIGFFVFPKSLFVKSVPNLALNPVQ